MYSRAPVFDTSGAESYKLQHFGKPTKFWFVHPAMFVLLCPYTHLHGACILLLKTSEKEW